MFQCCEAASFAITKHTQIVNYPVQTIPMESFEIICIKAESNSSHGGDGGGLNSCGISINWLICLIDLLRLRLRPAPAKVSGKKTNFACHSYCYSALTLWNCLPKIVLGS